jgi:hypothetical protein
VGFNGQESKSISSNLKLDISENVEGCKSKFPNANNILTLFLPLFPSKSSNGFYHILDVT